MNIKLVVKKELEKNLKKQELITQEIESLPVGSLVKVKQHNNIYVYLKYREASKVISKYIGKDEDVLVTKFEIEIENRKNLEKRLKALKEEETLINKMLKVK